MKLKLRDIANVRSGYSFRSRVEHDPAGDTFVVSMKDIVRSGQINSESLLKISADELDNLDTHTIEPFEILFQSRGSNNYSSIAAGVKNSVAGTGMMRIMPFAEKILPEYLLWFLNQDRTLARIRASATGTQIPFISTKELEIIQIEVPSMKNQEMISNANATRARQIKLQQELSTLTDTLLHEQCWQLARAKQH